MMYDRSELYHYGIPRRSGRYPWGSGDRPYQGDKQQAISDIEKIISGLNKSDYRDFSFKNLKHFRVEYDKDKPVAFAYDRTYSIGEKDKGVVISVGTDPKYRGQGLGKKAVQDVLKQAINDKSISEIAWGADKTNENSVRLAKSVGFEHWYDYGDGTYYKYPLKIKHSNLSEDEKMQTYDPNSELYHFGTPRHSGRYPWGSGERPKQALFGSRRKERAKKKNAENESSYEERKKRALEKGTATEILQFRGDLTTKEMNDAYQRINAERQLIELSKKEVDDGWNAVNRAMKKVGNVTDWAQTSLKAYGMLQQVMDAASKSTKNSGNKK